MKLRSPSLETCVTNAEGHQWRFIGRNAWALLKLIERGPRGVTPIDTPAPRWSAYVHNLRREGIDIETVWEAHKGAFPGCHARYILRSNLSIVDQKAA
ncbi:helix-turn-helix domain-containing protein [Hyphococcus formosus]|uniref:winged helix domain-containing protein n=1 Tax=Hyphococcus formosus TaxID=3143534 RepID=UPI00398BA9B8